MDKPLQPRDPAHTAVRASDADRENVATLLRDAYADGRLTLDEFQQRLDLAYSSKTLGELDDLTRDLARPGATQPAAIPVTPPAPSRWTGAQQRILSYVVLMVFLVAIWVATGGVGDFWPKWPIIIGGFLVLRDVLGLAGPRSRSHDRRRELRARRRVQRDRYLDRDDRVD